jgi:capsular polysaccharide biosynthesis protein
MAETAVDVRLVLASLRRHRNVLVVSAVVGALVGMASVFLWPPMYASSSLVLLPPRAVDPNQMAELVKTDIRIATSDAVLGPAAESLEPRMSVEQLARHVDVSAATSLVLRVEGRAEEPARAEEISAAVANADVTYIGESLSSASSAKRSILTEREEDLKDALEKVTDQIDATTARLRDGDPGSQQGSADATALASLTAQQGKLTLQLQELESQTEAVQPSGGASVIQEPSPAERPGLATRFLGAVLLGAVIAVLVVGAVITLLTRRDPRLFFRDHIADAVGSPVIASTRTGAISSVADWIALLHDYAPATVDAWAWRRALRQLGFDELPPSSEERSRGRVAQHRRVTVVTLSADPRGLATGPQLAAYAASAGIRTHLVAAQRHESAAALWAACSRLEENEDAHPGLSVQASAVREPEVDLTVRLVVLDRLEPKLLDAPADSAVVLGLSAGSATAEELARAAVAVDEAGDPIRAVVVADPDDLDRTSGRLLQHERLRQLPLPTRLTGSSAPRVPGHARPDLRRRQG